MLVGTNPTEVVGAVRTVDGACSHLPLLPALGTGPGGAATRAHADGAAPGDVPRCVLANMDGAPGGGQGPVVGRAATLLGKVN